MWFVNTALGWVESVIIIGIAFERFGIDVFVREFASDNWLIKKFIGFCYAKEKENKIPKVS